MQGEKLLKLAVSLAASLAAGALGSIFTASSVDGWYRTIEKPPFNPPAWVFAPVWTILYIMMGVSLFLVWSARGRPPAEKEAALVAFAVQLGLNTLWSAFFFGLENPGLAFLEILLLWAAILATILLFRKISPLAAGLLLPYLLWVTFASVLNGSIFLLNRP